MQSFRCCACNFHKLSLLQELVTSLNAPLDIAKVKQANISSKDSSFGGTIIFEINAC